jgi:outer membrane protein
MNRPVLCLSLLLALPAAAQPERRMLTLKDALANADANLPSLRQAAADTAVLQAQADESRAPLLPQLNGTGTYQRTTANYAPSPGVTLGTTSSSGSTGTATTSTTPTSGNLSAHPKPTSATFNYWRFGATLTQTLFDAPTFSYWRAALASIGAQRATWDAARLDAAYNVRTAYFTARANAALTDVAKQTVENQQKHLVQVEGYVQVGTHPEIDLYQSKSDLANAQVALITAQNNYDTSKATLNQAMGVAMDTEYDLQDAAAEPVDFEDSNIEDDVAYAEKTRPELKAFDEKLRSEVLTKRGALFTWSPTLGFTANVQDVGVDLTNLSWNYYIQVGASWNFFNGLNSYSQVKQANAQIASYRAQLDTERLQVRLELEKGRLAVRAGKASIISATDAYENAKVLERLAEGRYKAGVGNAVELSDAILQQANSAAQLVQAQFNLSIARGQFLRALGRR